MNFDAVRPPRWLRWAAVAFVAGGIFYASVLASPSSGLPSMGPLGVLRIDKWLHATAYAGLAVTLANAFAPRARTARVVIFAVLLSVGYGVGVEFAQAPLAERSFSLADMAANAVGAGLGVVAWRALVGVLRQSGVEPAVEAEL
ncbi:VanZ family protein [Halorussus litoreus]|uniref:VanZ family protein n=1 Tax=Halorussus litoreus TaxID=1710536 RepID=UPI000E23F314|nr:VanZ family protein [Halorussus litoreus]